MTEFSPSRPPSGHLARLGVVLDADERAVALAGLCDRAGINIVWLADRPGLASGRLETATIGLAERIAPSLERAALGLFLSESDDVRTAFGLPGLSGLAALGRIVAAGTAARLDTISGDPVRIQRGVVVNDLAALAMTLPNADDIILPAWRFGDLETAADEVRAAASDAGRDPTSLGVGALVPVSIGRTQAEAMARISADPLFEAVGDPAAVGIFGTLEECQDRAIALAHAGFTDLLCIVPATLDVHDVIAQLTAITVGTTEVLVPGSLRSPSPPPPDGWGGRSPIPERPRVSDGSRRR